jgi:hypothetical protein
LFRDPSTPVHTFPSEQEPPRDTPPCNARPSAHFCRCKSSLTASFVQPHRQTQRRCSNTVPMSHHRISLIGLDRIKLLEHPHNHIPGLRQGKSLSQANTRASIKWQELSARSANRPTLPLEFLHIEPPDICSMMYYVYRIIDFLALSGLHRRISIGASSSRNGTVSRRPTRIDRYCGV